MSLSKKTYTMDWATLIHTYNKNNVGQISQNRLAEVFNQSTAVICLDQTKPKSYGNLETKYHQTYIKLFESIIPFKKILVEHVSINKKV